MTAALVGLGILLVAALWTCFVCWKIIRDNRPGPRWPGDP